MPYVSKYSDALASRICSRIAEGRSLRDVCRDKDVPVAASTVTQWVLDREAFAEKYGRACGLRTEARFEELLTLADEFASITETPEGPILRVCEREQVNPLRAKIDTLKWALSKMKPERYSDKLQVEQQGTQEVRVVVEYADDTPTPE
jgi:hypothetical protein